MIASDMIASETAAGGAPNQHPHRAGPSSRARRHPPYRQ
jgi:hypothetical protein